MTARYTRRGYRQTRTLACRHVVERIASIPLNGIGELLYCPDCERSRIVIGATNDTWTQP